jgi:hypothetical protein
MVHHAQFITERLKTFETTQHFKAIFRSNWQRNSKGSLYISQQTSENIQDNSDSF